MEGVIDVPMITTAPSTYTLQSGLFIDNGATKLVYERMRRLFEDDDDTHRLKCKTTSAVRQVLTADLD